MIPTANESNQHNYVTTDLDQILTQISTAKYGSEVRQAIYDGVGQAWENAEAAATSATNAASAADTSALDAETALSAAQNAQTAAETAQSAAQDAVTDAQTAITNANTAITNANTAIQQAQGVIDGVSFDVGTVTSVGYGNPPTASLSYQGNGDYLLNLGLVPGSSVDAGGDTIPLDNGTVSPTIRNILNILENGNANYSGTAFNPKANFIDLGNGSAAGITNASLPTAYPEGISIISDLTASGANWPFADGEIITLKHGQKYISQSLLVKDQNINLTRYYGIGYEYDPSSSSFIEIPSWSEWVGLTPIIHGIQKNDRFTILGSTGGNADSDSIQVTIPVSLPNGYSKILGIAGVYFESEHTTTVDIDDANKRLSINSWYINEAVVDGQTVPAIILWLRNHYNYRIKIVRILVDLLII